MTLEAAVEALARAMGLRDSATDNSVPGVYIGRDSTGKLWEVWRRVDPFEGGDLLATLEDREALLWLRCYMLGTTRVRCPDCEGELEVIDYDARTRLPASKVSDMPPRPCPTCSGKGTMPGKPTGHVDRPWAEVLLGAMPRWREVGDGEVKWCDECFREGDEVRALWLEIAEPERGACSREHMPVDAPGDPEARTLLTVKADELQANGDPLGLWLALYLGQQPCEPCSGLGRGFDEDGSREWHCMVCGDGDSRGSGLALGAHDRAMAEAGERLAEQLGASTVGRA